MKVILSDVFGEVYRFRPKDGQFFLCKYGKKSMNGKIMDLYVIIVVPNCVIWIMVSEKKGVSQKVTQDQM